VVVVGGTVVVVGGAVVGGAVVGGAVVGVACVSAPARTVEAAEDDVEVALCGDDVLHAPSVSATIPSIRTGAKDLNQRPAPHSSGPYDMFMKSFPLPVSRCADTWPLLPPTDGSPCRFHGGTRDSFGPPVVSWCSASASSHIQHC
jgi:hypothetical protein